MLRATSNLLPRNKLPRNKLLVAGVNAKLPRLHQRNMLRGARNKLLVARNKLLVVYT